MPLDQQPLPGSSGSPEALSSMALPRQLAGGIPSLEQGSEPGPQPVSQLARALISAEIIHLSKIHFFRIWAVICGTLASSGPEGFF